MTGFVTAGSGSESVLNPAAHSSIDHTGILGVGCGGGDAFPVGCIVPFGASTASIPGGWIACDGSEYGRTGLDASPQPTLFGIIGTLWGIGNGSTSFNVPDLRARSLSSINDGTLPAGQDGGFSSRSVAATSGAETHSHTVNSHNHSISSDGSHTHTGSTGFAITTATPHEPDLSTSGTNNEHFHSFTTASNGSHSHFGGTGNASPGTTAGSSLGPTAFCPFIIKAVSTGGGAGGISAQVNAGPLQGPQPTVNYIEGPGISVTAVQNIPQNRNDVTITASGGLTLVERKEFLADTPSYSFAGLDGNTDETYVLRGSILPPAAGTNHNYYLRPNGLNTNMQGSAAQFTGVSTAHSQPNELWLAYTATGDPTGVSIFDATFDASFLGPGATPKKRGFSNQFMTGGTTIVASGQWQETVSNVTSLLVIDLAGNGIGTGSWIELYKV